jgi:hypothetical protein
VLAGIAVALVFGGAVVMLAAGIPTASSPPGSTHYIQIPPWPSERPFLVPQPTEVARPSVQRSRPYGQFRGVGHQLFRRDGASAFALVDGRVLLVGGAEIPGSPLTHTEIYDPGTEKFTAGASMSEGRRSLAGVVLADGRVFVAGGSASAASAASQPLKTAEIYDPGQNSFSRTGSMAEARVSPTATLLPDGRVLVVGGSDIAPLRTAELYDPKTGTFSGTGEMHVARYQATATRLNDGTVLVVGGDDNGAQGSAEIYDPEKGTFTLVASSPDPRYGHTATLLLDGRVLIVGGQSGLYVNLSTAQAYDPKTGRFADAGDMGEPTSGQASALLPDGRVLVTGGQNHNNNPVNTAYIWDPTTETFTALEMSDYHSSHTATRLGDGTVLITDGQYSYAGELWVP